MEDFLWVIEQYEKAILDLYSFDFSLFSGKKATTWKDHFRAVRGENQSL